TDIRVTRRDLLASEFAVPFDGLPPAVARHLLALPDALTYQFVAVLQPDNEVGAPPPHERAQSSEPAHALFSTQLYLATTEGYQENHKLVSAGSIGLPRQTLSFAVPPATQPYTTLRLDPADRPGFFKLYQLRLLLPDGTQLWDWEAGKHDTNLLSQCAHQQMLFQHPWALSDSTLLFLYGDDPWLELPLPESVLQQASLHGARLEVICGWPMSADYMQAGIATQLALAALQAKLETEFQLQVKAITQEQQRQPAVAESVWRALQKDKQNLSDALNRARLNNLVQQDQLRQLQQHLQTIEASTVFRVTRPIVNFKMHLDRLFGKAPDLTAPQLTVPMTNPIPLPTHPVDIIVPVYRGIEDTRRCIESVLNAPCQTAWRLIVINDCSPEPEVTEWLRSIALTDKRMTLLENTENLGFVATVNRGMSLHADNDVLLLNSDAEVANDWLDRIQRAAYSAPRVASVTPFSNNATICSYPRFCQPNDLPTGYDTAALDRLFANHLAGQTLAVPTGVGFCMYVRRQCLQEVGLFDVDNFGKGYGEENDFCVRAQLAGWTNLHALDTFVRHAGGISFGGTKSEREVQAMETLRRLHHRYEPDVMNFVAHDPARPGRLLIDIARILDDSKPVILNVIHNREGGTLRHIQELADRLGKLATFLRLSPAPGGVTLKLEGADEAFALHFAIPQDRAHLVRTLRQLQVGHVHYHHLLGHSSDIAELAAQLGVSHDFTVHDYFSYCPQISLTDHTDQYCGEKGLEQCHQCLKRQPAPEGASIESWRERHSQLLRDARFVIAPSQDTALRLKHFEPSANVIVVPHSALELQPPVDPKPRARTLKPGKRLKVVVLGALSKIKGADVLEEVALSAAQRNIAVDFHLIGYAYRSLRTQPKARLTVHGGYDDKDLLQLLQWLQPDVIWFPAVWPETYSYTLSTSLESGLPIVAPNIGAFAERLQNRDWTWLCDWHQSANRWVNFFNDLRENNFGIGINPQHIAPLPKSEFEAANTFAYRGNYLASLPRPITPPLHELLGIQQQLRENQQWLDNGQKPGNGLKSSTLHTIVWLRASTALSPLARLVPTHLQRRVKSWLGK
ncbi:glycosyltransferase, partial [Rhodoferax sp.]|uniref:glycosyltransferase family 2 protein n=1 Tax=Rhodoferax sp. TaxID=50421 RepID=UPI00262B0E3D